MASSFPTLEYLALENYYSSTNFTFDRPVFMDSINPNPHFNASRINSIYHSQKNIQTPKPSSHLTAQQLQAKAVTRVEKIETFSSMFDDKELERLQKNLESIASLAQTALTRFKPENN